MRFRRIRVVGGAGRSGKLRTSGSPFWRAGLGESDERKQLDWRDALMDGTFAPAKKGAPPSAQHAWVRGQSYRYWSTARVLLSESSFSAADRNEVELAAATLAQVAVPDATPDRAKQKPARPIADCGYDRRPLWERMKQRGIDLIVHPYRDPETPLSGWPEAPAVSAALDYRADERVAPQLSASRDALRVLAGAVPSVRAPGVRHDRPTSVSELFLARSAPR